MTKAKRKLRPNEYEIIGFFLKDAQEGKGSLFDIMDKLKQSHAFQTLQGLKRKDLVTEKDGVYTPTKECIDIYREVERDGGVWYTPGELKEINARDRREDIRTKIILWLRANPEKGLGVVEDLVATKVQESMGFKYGVGNATETQRKEVRGVIDNELALILRRLKSKI